MNKEDGPRHSRPNKWSVMIYMAGDNNLSEEMVWGLQEMNEYFSGHEDQAPNIADLSVYFDAFGAYPRRYRFPNKNAEPDAEFSGPDGNLREYSKTAVPGGGKEEMVLKEPNKLEEVEWTGIAREVLSKAPEANPIDLGNIGEFKDLKTLLSEMPSEEIAGRFPDTSPDSIRNHVKSALKTKLGIAAKYLLNNSAASAQLQELVFQAVLQFVHDGPLEPGGLRAIVLSGHGNGSFGDFLPDSDPGSALSIPDIGTFLKLARKNLPDEAKIDILGMDACLMSTLEVCYEVRHHAKFLVGAEGFVPLAGWPYQRVLESFSVSGPETAGEETARKIVNSYYRYYRDYEDACVSTDISAIRLGERIDNVVTALGTLTTAIRGILDSGSLSELDEMEELEEHDQADGSFFAPEKVKARELRNALILARWTAQSYQWENQVDIWDFCDQLKRFLGNGSTQLSLDYFGGLRDLCDTVKSGVDDAILMNGWSGTDFQHSHGLSIYFPFSASEYIPEYYDGEKGRYHFAEDSDWGVFLRDYFLKLTRRLRRYQKENSTSGVPHEPRRQGIQDDPLLISAYSNYRVRSGGPFNTRSGGPFNTRSGGPFNTRSSGPFNTKSSCSRVKNAPDGYYPTPPRCPGTE